MKTTIDIPEKDLREVLRHTGAKTKREAVVTAVQKFNQKKRLEALAIRLRGSMPNLMTQEELKGMREDHRWGAAK